MSKRKSVDNSDGVLVQKPRANVYTMMLILTLIAIVTAAVLMYLARERYAPDYGTVTHRAAVEHVDTVVGSPLLL